MKNLIIKALAATMVMSATMVRPATAQTENETKFTIRPTGRVLVDGAVFGPDGDGFSDGVCLPDIRMGVKATYGKWYAKIDVGYSFGKIGMKDVYMQYSFNQSNLLRLGYFVHQFGLNAATSSSMKPAMEAPVSDTYFAATGRNLGLMYVLDKEKVFLGASAMVAGTSMTTYSNDQGKISGGAIGRIVYRPFTGQGSIAQAGLSLWYQSALHKKTEDDQGRKVTSPGYFDFSCGFPTRVCKVGMLGADIEDARGVFKLSPELVLSKGRLALESQYYFMNVSRDGGRPSYRAHGVYGLLRGLIIGDREYSYSHADAGLATPKPGSLECVLGYNYTDASCSHSGIYGGKSNDYFVTLNYYINKYMIARLRYSYTDVRGSSVQRDRHVNTLQARVQFLF